MMENPCVLQRGNEGSALAYQCWRGECIVCGWEAERQARRKKDIRENGLAEATEEEIERFLNKYDGVLTSYAIAHIKAHGLRFYKFRNHL